MMAMFCMLLLLLLFSSFVNSDLRITKNILTSDNIEVPQIDPGKLQYIVKPGELLAQFQVDASGIFKSCLKTDVVIFNFTNSSFSGDFLGLSKLSFSENKELQKICGISNFEDRDFKVAMGISAGAGEFPWAVALGEEMASCTGTIISTRHIATAAHCLSQYTSKQVPCEGASIITDPSKYVISYGGVCLSYDERYCPDGRDTKKAQIRKVILPQFFNENLCNKGADIAIMELKDDLQFDDKTKPICIGFFEKSRIGTMMDLGFGRNEHSTPVPNLRYVTSSLYEKQPKEIGNVDTIPKYFLPEESKQPGMCSGDSGGPFQVNIGSPSRSYLHGIHSFGSGCGNKSVHSSTNVLNYIDWICRNTGICRE